MFAGTPYPFPSQAELLQRDDPTCQFYRNLSNLYNTQTLSDAHEFNLIFGEPEVQPTTVIDEKKQRRTVSNRESARRCRMRKRMQTDELMSQLMQLRNENHGLVYKLKNVADCHDHALQENAKLKEEISDFQRMLSSVQVDSPWFFSEDSYEGY